LKNRNLLLLLLLASLWGPSFLFIKIAVQDFPPITLVTIRLSLAALILYGILRLNGRNLPWTWEFWKKFILMGFFANAFPFTLFSFGEQFADSGAASILNATTPIFTVIFAHFFVTDERFTLSRLGGVLVGFVGILFIFYPAFQNLLRGEGLAGDKDTIGLLAFILASSSYGISLVYARLNLRGFPPLVGPTAQLIAASILVLPVALLVEKPFHLTPSVPALSSLLALGIFGTAAAYFVYYKLIDSAAATFISLVTYLLPPIGVVLGVIFLHENPGWYSLVGLTLIILGVMIVNGLAASTWKRIRGLNTV
jgi:drug/metabolite transporter (DMT)-like permease